MATEETALCSPLDKPLKDLTEEDISQLTREDCRRFLKQKGMRRPSWNKSQAIQQVISLKTLLESRPEPDNPAHAASPSSPPPLKVPASVESQNPVSASESVSDRGKDSTQSTFRGDALSAPPACDEILQRSTAANEPATAGQMTIFYCGKVKVYEEMSSEKARAILVLAGSPDCSLPIEIAPAGRSSACQQLGDCAGPASLPFATAISRCTKAERPTGRKASLQRYLEKRKDRGRFKGKRRSAVTTSGMEMYLSQQIRSQASTEHSSRSGTCSPTQPRPPHTPTRCGSVENQVKSLHLIVDLNDDEIKTTCIIPRKCIFHDFSYFILLCRFKRRCPRSLTLGHNHNILRGKTIIITKVVNHAINWEPTIGTTFLSSFFSSP
ncbi:protein TIFY 4B-like isoform X2 [Aristolochia californica]|uniref:protein TIFY 4B-like isoform X2 n=1 Tax=Aristolochia californica TaxID=171875 RepID=UPI0035D78B9E